MISALISRLVILVFGTLYPAYSSYKAVKTKDIKLYVKWMMYWIVFALFTAAETFTDIFFSFWFPFYYELKICLVFWLLSPLTRGSSIIYRKVIHPLFMRREQEIDDLIAKAKDQGYNVILDIGCKSMTFATHAIMNTAVKGGSGLLFQLRKSYSLNDLTEDITNGIKETRRNRQKDCIDNFRGDEIIESKIMLTESQTDLDVTDDDTRFNSQEYRKTRKSSFENLALKDCKEIRSNLRPRRSNRQDPENTRPISTKISPYYPIQPLFPSDYLSPFLYYSMTNKYLLPPPDKNLTHNFLNIRTNVNLYPNLKKASSTPNIFNESDNWMLTDSLATESKESKKTETKKRRKRKAPKPPTDLPLIFVNSVSDQQIDVDRLAPKLKTKAKQNKSKLQQFLSKSRELLHWKTDEGDSFSIRSDLSDDSVSTTSSYNTVLTPIRNSSTLPRKRQTKKRTI